MVDQKCFTVDQVVQVQQNTENVEMFYEKKKWLTLEQTKLK